MEQLFSISLNTSFHIGSTKNNEATQLVKHSLKKIKTSFSLSLDVSLG